MRKQVLVVGGGFAGLAAARALGDRHAVTLIDRRPSFEFLPNIHEIVSGLKTPARVRLPLAQVLRRLDQRFLEDEVLGLDAGAAQLHTRDHGVLAFDALILAPGMSPSSAAVEGAEQHALTLRSAADAERLRASLAALTGLGRWSQLTLAGGGITGIEVLGEVLRAYRKRRLAVRLIEPGARLARGWPEALHRRVQKLARAHDVELIYGQRVVAVGPGEVGLSSGRSLRSDLTVLTAGASLPPMLAHLARGPREAIAVGAGLQLPGRAAIFLAGDVAEPPSVARKQAAEALRLGHRAGRNVRRALAGEALRPFERKKQPVLVTFGDLSAFLLLPDGTVVESPRLAAGRELVFLEGMALLDSLSGRRARRRLEKRMGAAAEALDLLAFAPLGLRVHQRR